MAGVRNRDAVLVLLPDSSSPLLQASSLSLSTSLSAKPESLLSCLPSVRCLCKPHAQSQHYSFPAVVGRDEQWDWPTRAAHSPFPAVTLVVALPPQLAQLSGCG